MTYINLELIKERLKQVECLVLGDVMQDRYIYGEVGRISPEAPIPVVRVEKIKEHLGGAANVAANIRYFGCRTYLCGVIGTDVIGNTVLDILKSKDIDYCGLRSEKRITTTKSRIVGRGQQLLRFDEEVWDSISFQNECEILKQIEPLLKKVSIIVISDYAKGVCTSGLCSKIISQANTYQIKVIIDPKGTKWEKYAGAYMVTPNWKEFTEIAGKIDPEDDKKIEQKALELLERYHLKNILITRSERGMTLVAKDLYISYSVDIREVSDVSGAGDTAVATLAAFLAAGAPLKESVYWANCASGLAVEHSGTSVIGIEQLVLEQKHMVVQMDYSQKVKTMESLLEQLSFLRKQDIKIIFTNGCFDILHSGHIQFLNEAKKLGDFLIVAVNTDRSVRSLNKGKGRPINGEEDRSIQLAALQMVDAVVLFDEDTPLEVIKQIQPDILVKGGDYEPKDIVGREYATETKVLPLKGGYSTTRLIEKIRHI